MPKVRFHYADVRFRFEHRNQVKLLVEKIFQHEKKKLGELNYVFCSDKQLLEMNVQWLDHDTYTDIITFDLSLPGGPVVGEIYISVDRVRDNSVSFKTDFQEELRRVIFHGALHLCGFKDKTKAQQAAMRTAESKWLERYKRST